MKHVVLALVAAASLTAAPAARSVGVGAGPTPQAVELARRFVRVEYGGGDFLGTQLKIADLDAVIARHPELGDPAAISPARRAAVLGVAAQQASAAIAPGFFDRVAVGYARLYDIADLQVLAAYFDSPMGRDIAAKQAGMSDRIKQIGSDLATPMIIAKVCATTPPPTPTAPPPADALARRVIESEGLYRVSPLRANIDELKIAGLICGPGAAVPRYDQVSDVTKAVSADLESRFSDLAAVAYAQTFTKAELEAMAAFEDSAAGRDYDRNSIVMPASIASIGFELKRQFAASACAQLGCTTPPDGPSPPWAEPSTETLELARRMAADSASGIGGFAAAINKGPLGALLGKMGMSPKDQQLWIAAGQAEIDTMKPQIIEETAHIFAEAYSQQELRAAVDFNESPVGESIYAKTRAAVATFRRPDLSPQEKQALDTFNSSPAGLSISAKKIDLAVANVLLMSSLIPAENDAIRQRYCAMGGDCKSKAN